MSSQVVYFTATFPYVLLVAITAYGLTLPGALDGVKELFVPKAWTGPKTITDPQVWRKAAEQMFYSLSVSFVVKKLNITICTHQVSWGGLVMFGSYNKFGHKVHITAATTSILDILTTVIIKQHHFHHHHDHHHHPHDQGAHHRGHDLILGLPHVDHLRPGSLLHPRQPRAPAERGGDLKKDKGFKEEQIIEGKR